MWRARTPHIGAGEGAQAFKFGWRWFYTQQHGDNPTWEVLPAG
jgi:hypothetical protein